MPNRKIPSDSIIKEDYKSMSSVEMAKKYKVTRVTVCRHLRKLNITRPLSGANSRNKKRNGEVTKTGYPVLHLPNHSRATAVGYVFKHILEIEKRIGRTPTKSEPIHHIDFDRKNYNLDNLYLCKSNSDHQRVHNSLNKITKALIKNKVIGFKSGEYVITEIGKRLI